MKSHELLRSVIKPYGCKLVASALKLSLSIIHKWTKPRADGRSEELNPLDRIVTLIQLTGDLRPLHWLCQKCGGFFVKNPQPEPSPAALGPAENKVIHAQSEFESFVAVTAQKGCVTEAEATEFRARWERVKSVTEGFIQACERGSYRCGAWFFPALWFFTTGELPELVTV